MILMVIAINHNLIRLSSPKGKRWLEAEIERIHKMFEAGATQLDIAIEFPERKWDKIFGILRDKYGDDAHRFDYQPVRWQETFNEFKERYGTDQPLPLRSPGVGWREPEDQQLLEFIATNANRTEIVK